MESNTQLQTTKPESQLAKFRNLLSQETIKAKFNEALGKKAPLFMSNLVTIMSGSVELQKCEHMSIISSALMAASMDLPLTPGLGFAGIVPYWDTPSGTMKAQFQVMKKGYIQLAQRTGLFKIIHVSEVFEGELKSHNKFTGEFVFDETGRKSDNIVGYVSYFRLINGFEKYFYMPIEKLDRHAKKYSKSFQKGKGKWADKEEGGYEQMCEKTVLKLNLATYAPLSVDINMMNAIVYDQAEIRDMEAKDYDYIDNEDSHKAEEKEVLETKDGKQIVINKSEAVKTTQMTERAAESIPENKFGEVKTPNDSPFISQRGSMESFNGKITKIDGVPIDKTEHQLKEGQLSLEQMEKMDTKVLLGMVNTDTDMIEAMELIPGKNTNKKLREIIFAHQGGRLAEHVAPFLSEKNEEKQDNANTDVKPNKEFDKEKSGKETDDFLNAPFKGQEDSANKYNLTIPAFDKGQQRDFATTKQLFNLLTSIDPPINSQHYLEIGGKLGLLTQYADKELFCKLAPVSVINDLLNKN